MHRTLAVSVWGKGIGRTCRDRILTVTTLVLLGLGLSLNSLEALPLPQDQIPLAWKASPLVGDCTGPKDGQNRYWFDHDFDESAWTVVSMPNRTDNAGVSDRYYRAHFDLGSNLQALLVKLWFASDDGIWIYVNGHYFGHWGADCHGSCCVNNPGNCSCSQTIPAQAIPSSWLRSQDNVVACHVSSGGGELIFNASLTTSAIVSGFTDVTYGSLGFAGDTYGVAWGDYDGDGDEDLYMSNGGANLLLRNDGGGAFTDVTSGPIGDAAIGRGVAWGDYDNDGDLDLYLANFGSANKLFRNDGSGVFADVTSGPLGDTGYGHSAVWGDYDNDGDLDLYLANHGTANKLFRNEGNGTFTDATSGPLGDTQKTIGAAWADYDNDGDLDLYFTNWQGGTNKLLRNGGAGVFVDATSGPLAGTGQGCGVDWGDYDNDGDLDLYVTNDHQANKLYRNDGGGVFTDVTSGPLGDTGAAGGVAWADYDNDGDLDIYMVNREGGGNKLLRNEGGGIFVDATSGPLGDTGKGQGCAWADYDNDGDLDLYLANNGGPNKLFRNDLNNGNHWIHVKLVGTLSNRAGIGARVKIVSCGKSQIREIAGGSGFYSQNSLIAAFGLGACTTVDELDIRWPSGINQKLTSVSADRLIQVTEPDPIAGIQGIVFHDIDGDGVFTLGLDHAIAGATVATQFADKTLTDNFGSYIFEPLRATWGYSVTASAQGFCPKTIQNLEVRTGKVTRANIALVPLSSGIPKISSIVPDPNPQISTIEEGGNAHRYYLVADEASNIPLVNANVSVQKNGLPYNLFSANEYGQVDISIPSSDIGSGEPNQTESFEIVSINGTTLGPSEQLSFSCRVTNRESEKTWENATYSRVGLSYVVAEEGTGTRTCLIEKAGSQSVPDTLRIERQGRSGSGLQYRVQAPLQISFNKIGWSAEAGAEGLHSITTNDAYQFPYPIPNDAAAEAEFILLTSSKVSIFDPPLTRLLTLLEDFYGASLDDAYFSDSKGVDFRGSVKGEFFIGFQASRRISIGGKLEGGVEAHENVSSEWLAKQNAERLSVGSTVSASVDGGLGFVYNKPKSVEAELLLDKLGLNESWSGTWGGEFASISDGTSKQQLAIEIASVKRVVRGSNAQEDSTKITVKGQAALSAFKNLPDHTVSSFLSPWGSTISLLVGPSIFGSVLFDGMEKVKDLQDPQKNPINVVNNTQVAYEKSKVDYSQIDGFDVSIDVSLTGEQTVSGHIGSSREFWEGYGAAMERGKLIRGIPYALESYSNVPHVISTSYQTLYQQIIDRIPATLRYGAFLTDILRILFSRQQVSLAQADTFRVGDCGSKIIFPSGSVPDFVTSILSSSWGWWGSSPCSSALMLSPAQRSRHQTIRAQAEQSYGMSYGVGGFYQFEPCGLALRAPATFIMTYRNADVVGISESDLRMYKEIKATHEFKFIGGVVDTLNNTVTALVDTLSLFTLAPRLPAGIIMLSPSPSMIPANGTSTALITSDTLRNNDGSKVGNGVLYTVSASSGFIMTADADTSLAGIQVASQNSVINFTLRSGPIAFNANVSASGAYGSAAGSTVVRLIDNAAPTPPSGLRILHCQSTGQVEAMWNPSPEPDVAGYKIYFDDDQSGPPYTGNVSAEGVPSPIDVMGDTSVVIVGLLPDRTYYLTVTAYDVAGNQSAYSRENVYALTGIGNDTNIPRVFSLETNYPNPFNPHTTIEYSLPKAAHVNLSIYDVQGRLICNLVDRVENAGKRRVIWDATNSAGRRVTSGVYFYRIVAGNYSESKKMILLR